ncbi:MAG: hypothetical protein V1750_09655 [Acidobacteriota bacterium]
MGRSWLAVTALVAIALTGAAPVCPTSTGSRPDFVAPFVPQGGFEVRALVGGVWQRVGEISCDRFFRERALQLPSGALGEGPVRVRLVQHGGGAAHIDAISLGETPPSRVDGARDPAAIALVARRDNDVVDAFGTMLELSFPASQQGGALRLCARVEGKIIEGSPFAFPPLNTFQPIGPDSAFYPYRPTDAAAAPFLSEALDPQQALFAELCMPTSGHPTGITYGWVANDRHMLYAAVEFTPDNTCDGSKDWSSVFIRRGDQVREFRVSENETRWGHPSFLATARASYHHKLYTFAIPFSELGIESAREAGELKIAFAAYGTAFVTFLTPTSIDFGAIAAGHMSLPHTVLVTNTFPGTNITLGTPWSTRTGPDSGVFLLSPGSCSDGLLIPPLGTCQFQVTYAPASVGPDSDGIVVHGTPQNGLPFQYTLAVEGQAVEPVPALAHLGLALLAAALAIVGMLLIRRH